MDFSFINWNVNPEIVNIFGFSIRYYGLLFVCGLILSILILKKLYKNEGLSNEAYEALPIYGMIGIFAGARLGHCLFYDFGYYSKHIIEIFLPVSKNTNGEYYFTGYQGLASHGGAIGLLLMLYLYAKKYHLQLLKVLDMVSIVAPLSGMFIRIANLMNSEIIGYPSQLPWAFVFKKEDNIPRHPAQLYEAIAYLLIYLFIRKLYNKRRNDTGTGYYFGWTIFLIFTMRFMIEFLKERQVSFENSLMIDMGQILSIPFVVIGIFMISYSYKNQRRKNI